MSHIAKLAAGATAIALTAGIVGGVAHDRGRADPQRSARYELTLASPAPLVAGLTVQAQSSRYRVRLAPGAVVDLGPRPSCHYVAWRTVRENDSR